MIARATLIKLKTDDGFVEMHDDVPLGRVYLVELTTRRMRRGMHLPTRSTWQREMVEDVEGGWLPTELLRIEA